MDLVVNRLSDIEEASVRIIEEANSQKKELDEEMTSDLKAYDAKVDAETDSTLNQLKEKLRLEMLDDLAKLQADTMHIIKMLETDYDANHEKLATGVFKKLVEG